MCPTPITEEQRMLKAGEAKRLLGSIADLQRALGQIKQMTCTCSSTCVIVEGCCCEKGKRRAMTLRRRDELLDEAAEKMQ